MGPGVSFEPVSSTESKLWFQAVVAANFCLLPPFGTQPFVAGRGKSDTEESEAQASPMVLSNFCWPVSGLFQACFRPVSDLWIFIHTYSQIGLLTSS